MSTFLTILLIILAFFGGMLAGMYLLRKQFEKEFASNPRLNVEAVRTLLGASGQRPSEAKVQQVYRQILNQQKAPSVSQSSSLLPLHSSNGFRPF